MAEDKVYNGFRYRQAGPGQPWVKVGPAAIGTADPIKVAGATKAQNEAAASAHDPAAAALDIRLKEAQLAKLNQEAAMPKPVPLTKGEEARDTEFAKEYADWVNSGGSATVSRNLGTLRDQLPKLEGSGTISGGIMGRLPDPVRQFINPDSINVQDNTENAVMGALKQILGAQFTQAEGERFLARSYNPKVDEGENAGRIRRAETELSDKAWAKGDSARYFNRKGTLKGHKPSPRPQTSGQALKYAEMSLGEYIKANALNPQQAAIARRKFYADPRVKKLTAKQPNRQTDDDLINKYLGD